MRYAGRFIVAVVTALWQHAIPASAQMVRRGDPKGGRRDLEADICRRKVDEITTLLDVASSGRHLDLYVCGRQPPTPKSRYPLTSWNS